MKRLTIAMLIYKTEKWIEYSLSSIINQTDKNFHLLLVDNGSTDNSITLAKKILNGTGIEYSIYRIENNIGAGNGRTVGYRVAETDYIKCMDSDDALEIDYVERINEVIQKSSPDIIAYGHSVYDEAGKILRELPTSTNKDFIKYGLTMFWRYCFKREIAIKANVDTSRMHFAEDRLFSLSLIPFIQEVYVIEKCLYRYTRNKKSVTNSEELSKFVDSNKIIFDKYGELFAQNPNPYLSFAINKFFVSILAKCSKSSRKNFRFYYSLYKNMLFSSLGSKKIIVPKLSKDCRTKESRVIQISLFLLKIHLTDVFRFVMKHFYK